MTKLLTIGLLLLSCEVAEAQQSNCIDCLQEDPYGTTYDICRMPEMRKSLRETADEPNPKMWYVDPQLGVMWTSPCEQKMKEAMKLMDKIMRGEWVHTPYNTYEYQSMVPNAQERKQWNAVMKECVK